MVNIMVITLYSHASFLPWNQKDSIILMITSTLFLKPKVNFKFKKNSLKFWKDLKKPAWIFKKLS